MRFLPDLGHCRDPVFLWVTALIKHLLLVSFHVGVYLIRSGELTIQLDSQLALPSDNWSAHRDLPLAVKTLANQPFPMINERMNCAPVPDGQKIA